MGFLDKADSDLSEVCPWWLGWQLISIHLGNDLVPSGNEQFWVLSPWWILLWKDQSAQCHTKLGDSDAIYRKIYIKKHASKWSKFDCHWFCDVLVHRTGIGLNVLRERLHEHPW